MVARHIFVAQTILSVLFRFVLVDARMRDGSPVEAQGFQPCEKRLDEIRL